MLVEVFEVLTILSTYLDSVGISITSVDISRDTLIAQVYRRGRTDEEIDKQLREVRIVVTLTYLFGLHIIACPLIKYKIVEHV